MKPTFDEYRSPKDGVNVVYINTDELPENKEGPIIRIYLNDEPIFVNPDLEELRIQGLESEGLTRSDAQGVYDAERIKNG